MKIILIITFLIFFINLKIKKNIDKFSGNPNYIFKPEINNILNLSSRIVKRKDNNMHVYLPELKLKYLNIDNNSNRNLEIKYKRLKNNNTIIVEQTT